MMRSRVYRAPNVPTEVCAQLYIGDYFSDTLPLSSEEHGAFGKLLLYIWLNKPKARPDFASITGLAQQEWREMRDAVLPLFEKSVANIELWKEALHAYDGRRLPPAEWHIVKTIVLARDCNTCVYCDSTRRLHIDHIPNYPWWVE